VGGVQLDGGGYADRTERERGLGVNVEIRPIKGIGLAKYNPRKISDQALDSLVQSIERFGFVDPVIVNDRTGILVGGHQRLKAAKKLGLKDVPVVAVNLDEAEEKALNVALNKISGEWDLELLRGVLEDVQASGLDLSLTGFTEDEWQAMGGTPSPVQGLTDPDEVPELPEEAEAITKPGDLWILGEHRLLCGDSTKAEDVERVMDGTKAGAVVTDPPYGIGIDGQRESISKNPKHNRKSHKFMGWDSQRPPKDLFDSVLSMSAPTAIFGGNYFADMLPASRGWVYWSKGQDGLSMSDGELAWTTESKPLRCVTVNRAVLHGSVHPTQKPVDVIVFALEYIEPEGGPIFDPFLGSGTTLIAAQQLGRKCYGMEISPQYCDVIVKRWEQFTGKKAHRAG
jgi:hypothetical protein